MPPTGAIELLGAPGAGCWTTFGAVRLLDDPRGDRAKIRLGCSTDSAATQDSARRPCVDGRWPSRKSQEPRATVSQKSEPISRR